VLERGGERRVEGVVGRQQAAAAGGRRRRPRAAALAGRRLEDAENALGVLAPAEPYVRLHQVRRPLHDRRVAGRPRA
jgi:hypothetical protein